MALKMVLKARFSRASGRVGQPIRFAPCVPLFGVLNLLTAPAGVDGSQEGGPLAKSEFDGFANPQSPGRFTSMTGIPGPKKSQHLIEAEAYRRVMSGELPGTLGEFALQLLDWFRQTYPDAPSITSEMIENQIRETWHRRHELIRGG